MDPTAIPTSWDCEPGEVMVCNRTGVLQVFSAEGVTLKPGAWTKLPLARANSLRAALIVDIYMPADPGAYLWQDDRGKHVYWMSPFSLGDGYGTGAEHTINSAIDLGLNAKLQACWFIVEKGLQVRTLENLRQQPTTPYLVGICMATPGEFKKLPTPYKIGFTMYESTDPLRAHPEWKPECNALDRLFVPSPWCKELFGSFLRPGLPIDVVPLVVNPLYEVAQERKPKDTFTFITFATLTGRKAPLQTAELFKKAFPRKRYPHVRLILKTRLKLLGEEGITTDNQRWGDDRIVAMDGNWLPEKMLEFMLQADCMLFLTFGEGFGLPPREALATGLPVILGNHTGMIEMCDDRYVWPVPTKEMIACPLGGDWFVPDPDIAIDMMRDVVDHPEKAFAKAKRGADWFIAQNDARVLVETMNSLDPITALEQRDSLHKARRGEVLEAPRVVLDELKSLHEPFLNAIKVKQGPVLEVGVGQGATHAGMLLRGNGRAYFGVDVREDVVKACRQNIHDAYGISTRLFVMDAFDMTPGRLVSLGLPSKFEAIVTEGMLEHFYDREVGILMRTLLALTDNIYFSVPSVFHEEVWEDCRQLRREQWIDIFNSQRIALRSISYYAGRTHVMGHIDGLSTGTRGGIERHGYVREGVWRPFQLLQK